MVIRRPVFPPFHLRRSSQMIPQGIFRGAPLIATRIRTQNLLTRRRPQDILLREAHMAEALPLRDLPHHMRQHRRMTKHKIARLLRDADAQFLETGKPALKVRADVRRCPAVVGVVLVFVRINGDVDEEREAAVACLWALV